ncbi:MAG: hypothetical protein H9855_14725 [Candidatus Acinetobacter avistercoris]|nr:hypothetical protein [Candidatus Acinetobacter avistercoris]
MFSWVKNKLLALVGKISNILNLSKKVIYLTLDVIATFLIGIGAAWLTSKGIDYYSIYFELSFGALKDFLISPAFLIILGGILYAISKIIGLEYTKKTLEDYNKIKIKNENLEKQMRSITEDNSILKKKLEISYSELVKAWLSTSLQSLGIKKPHIRATVYYYKNNVFYYVGRYSNNSIIANVSTNKVVLNGGVLSKAWELTSYMDLHDCPVYDEDSHDEYIKYQIDTYDFSEEKVNKLTMKPCQYYAKTITYRYNAIGVIVFESAKRTLTDSKVKAIEKHCIHNESNLINYIEKIKEYSVMVSQQSSNNSDEDVEKQFIGELEGKLNETK